MCEASTCLSCLSASVCFNMLKSVVFLESVRKNARDCIEKKGFAGNRHFQGTANFGYLEAI